MPTIQQEVESVISDNREPSEEVVCEVRRLLQEKIDEFNALESDIQQLYKKRRIVETAIRRYDPVLAPIRRLPSDILSQIFAYCLAEDRNPVISPIEAPILLTHVCSSWRSFALSFTPLWARIHISFTNQDILPPPNATNSTVISKDRIVEILLRRCKAIQEWFLRSGQRPLSISLQYENATTVVENADMTEVDNGATMIDGGITFSHTTASLCKILASVSDRWQHVEMDLPLHIYNDLLADVEPSRLSKLSTFRLSFHSVRHTKINQNAHVILSPILEIPNLKTLSFNFTLPTLQSNWNNITSLTIYERISLASAAESLRRFPGLVHLKLHLGSPPTRPGYLPIVLPHLRSMYITDSNVHESDSFYEAFEVPELTFISYRTAPTYGDTWYGRAFPYEWYPYVVAIAALLRKCTKLEAMRLYSNNYSNREMHEILHSVPGLKKFTYGPDQRGGADTRLHGLIHWEFPGVFMPWYNRGGTSNTPILPRLDTLEIRCTKTIPGLNEGGLVEFITSRMNPSNSLPSLSHVTVELYEPRRRNIMQDIQGYANQLGIPNNITLNLAYSYSPDVERRTHHVTKVDYGLQKSIWIQERIDEQDGFTI